MEEITLFFETYLRIIRPSEIITGEISVSKVLGLTIVTNGETEVCIQYI